MIGGSIVLLDFVVSFNQKMHDALEQEDSINRKIAEKRDKISRLEKSIKRLEDKRKKIPRVSWIDEVAKPLGKALADRRGKQYEVYGPFGIRTETTIYLMDDLEKGICKQDTLSITLVPAFDEEENMIFRYDTGKVIERFSPDTIGALNGCNNVEAPLPDSIEEIEKLLVEHKYEEV